MTGSALAILILGETLLLAPAMQAQMAHSVEPRPGIQHFVQVPLEYEHPERGSFELEFELGRAFEPEKQTVFVIADGQQQYLRPGLVAPLQEELFGDQFNVVGIWGRGYQKALERQIRSNAAVDWQRAYDLLKGEEWVGDIESVRRAIVGPGGAICLYGRSGGGLLVQQYLAKYPEHVRTVFIQAGVNRFVDAEFGLNSDHFWSDIATYDKSLPSLLLEALAHHPAERNRILLLLQRQNFFVPEHQIQQQRAHLIRVLDRWDQTEINKLSRDYQVDQVLASLTEDAASSVRVFELFSPVLRVGTTSMDRIDPDLEVGRMFGAPLLRLLQEARIKPPRMDLGALRRVSADVYLLAARFDHTADYRSQIALACYFPHHRLLLLSDDHDFLALARTGLYPRLVQAALAQGIHGPERTGVENQLSRLIYKER